jgi:hypothetical protein
MMRDRAGLASQFRSHLFRSRAIDAEQSHDLPFPFGECAPKSLTAFGQRVYPFGMSDNVLEFKPLNVPADASPMFASEGYIPGKCKHEATLTVSPERVTCSLCKETVEAIVALNILARREYWLARKENAAAYHRLYAEQEAEKQATKTRKAAYATLYRFGVTPEMYAEEYRRKTQFEALELKQDYSKALEFGASS